MLANKNKSNPNASLQLETIKNETPIKSVRLR